MFWKFMVAAVWLYTATPGPAMAAPVTWADMAHDSTSAVNRGPTPGDVIIIPHHRGWSVVWPYFTATMAGDTLCRHLYGSDAELALSRLGLHDQSPYDLTVTTVTIVFNRRGRQIGQPNISAPMDKTTFDQHFGAVISCPSVPFLLQPPTPPR